MPLTKKDLSNIQRAVHREVETAVETLAQVVQKAFLGVHKQFEALDKRIEALEKRISIIEMEIQSINARLDTIEHDIADIRKHFVYRDEFEDALARLKLVEKKLGIKSGK